jgi:zinc and cadmium transporter
MTLWYIIGFSLLGSVGGVALAGIFLLFPERIRQSLIPCLISYATGTLLGAAFLGLIPEAIESGPADRVFPAVLLGIILFFALEKFLVWRHCHEDHCDVHQAAGPLILIGDAFHNFVDGVIITVTFGTSIPLGIASSLAVVSHEIPQEVGDFAILLETGYSRKKAFFLNMLSGLSTFAGALLSYLVLDVIQKSIPYVMAVAAASFIYISMVDLFPSLHSHTGPKKAFRQLALMLAGIATIMLMRHDH